MDRGRPLKPLEVSGSTREELESLSRSLSLAAGLVSRAKIVLLCADGFDNKAVAEEVGTSRQTVGKWRERFRTQGLMGLYDERRPGKPRSIEDDEVMVLLRKDTRHRACRRQHALELPFHGRTRRGCPSPRFTASGKRSISNLIARSTSSSPPIRSSSRRSTISSDSTSTHPTTRWCSASTRRARPRRWSETQPLLPLGLGYVEGVTHGYIRHGTTTLFAALDVATGQILAQCKPRHRHQEFSELSQAH